MKMTQATTKRMATGLLAGILCQCELPDEDYFAQRWEELNQPEAVFEPAKWETAETVAPPPPTAPVLDEAEFPPLPYMSPELPLADGGARLTPSVVGNRTVGLLPSIDAAMAADRDFNVVDIPEWKPEQLKPAELPKVGDAAVVATANRTGAGTGAAEMIAGLGASLPLAQVPKAVGVTEEEAKKLLARADSAAGEGKTEVAKSIESKVAEKEAAGVAAAENEKEKEKVKVEGAAPGLALTKPPVNAELGKEWATGLGAGQGDEAKSGPVGTSESSAEKTLGDEVALGAAKAAEEVPEGVAVPGRTGLVKSPYGLPHQLVDVSDLKAGDMIKCPFSGKTFRVPKAALAVGSENVGSP